MVRVDVFLGPVYGCGGEVLDGAVDGADTDEGGGAVEGQESGAEVWRQQAGAQALAVEVGGEEDEGG